MATESFSPQTAASTGLGSEQRVRRRLLRMFRTPKGLIGLSLVVLFSLTAILSPLFIQEALSTKINVTARLAPPSPSHPLGTDQLGRELSYRVLLGARTSLMVAVLAVALSIVLGLPLGVLSGYFKGWTDLSLMRLVDTLLSFPVLLLALSISAILGPSVRNATVAIGIAFAPYLSRIVRSETLKVSSLPYIEAARAQGASDLRIITRAILPNILAPVMVQATISVAFAILAEAGLSFLGLGTQPPTPSWGLMIQASRDYLDVAPWTALVPGTAVALSVLGLNMLGDVLRDVLDPTFIFESAGAQ
ncbi:MAG: ABC transporter permease [Trueperaceae bacterium]|nr:MAG: ABC transporter permease [Trueperaceae bacterium]